MEKTDQNQGSRYPGQNESTAPPPSYTTAIQYQNYQQNRYNPPNFTAAQVVISTEPPIQPTSSIQYNPRYPPQYVEEPRDWYSLNQKNKPQSNSVGAAALIFISGGLNIAWSCEYTSYLTFTFTNHMRVCWFIGAIIGAVCSAIITNFMPKKPIFRFASILVVIDGILFMALPHNSAAITAALYLDGIANGLAIVPMLVMAGEELLPTMRGKVTSLLEAMLFACGMFVQITIATSYMSAGVTESSFGATELHGLLSIIYGALSILLTAFLVVESPIYYLQRDDENHAIDSLRRLQRPFTVTQETYRLLHTAKNYMDANRANPCLGLMALIKLCIYRGVVAFCFSNYTAHGLQIVVYSTMASDWPYIVSSVLLWLGTFIAGFLMDWVGRKPLMLLGGLMCGGMAIGIGTMFTNGLSSYLENTVYLYIILQFCAGFFISATPVYSTEAFPLRFKSYYVATAFIVQMLVLIIIGLCDVSLEGLAVYFITMGVVYWIFFFLALVFMPETKNDTLREAQDKFNVIFSRIR